MLAAIRANQKLASLSPACLPAPHVNRGPLQATNGTSWLMW